MSSRHNNHMHSDSKKRRSLLAQLFSAGDVRRVAEDRRDCYWLYVVTNCADQPVLQEPIKDPARFNWNEVKKVAHYWLEVNAMTRPMSVRESTPTYGKLAVLISAIN